MKNGPYTLIIAPVDYPGKKYRNRYAYEHHVVYWKNTGKLLDSKYVLHHINGNKTDNYFENLKLMYLPEHTKKHNVPRKTILLTCAFCNCNFTIDLRNYKVKTKLYHQTRFYCCRSHAVKNQHILKKQSTNS
jgi:hypothetical protein